MEKIYEPYSIEVIKRMYNHYLNNLKVSPIPFKYLNLDQLLGKFNYPFSSNSDKFNKEDNYVKDINILDMAKDLRENGTFWPITVSIEKDKTIEVQDGVHRLASLVFMTLEEDSYRDLYIPCLVFDYEQFGIYSNFIQSFVATIKRYKDRTYFFMGTKQIVVPDPDVFTNLTEFFDTALKDLKRRAKKHNSDGTFVLETNNFSEFFLVYTAYALILRNSIDSYNKNNPNDKFKGAFAIENRTGE
jgi:hypothetical protein